MPDKRNEFSLITYANISQFFCLDLYDGTRKQYIVDKGICLSIMNAENALINVIVSLCDNEPHQCSSIVFQNIAGTVNPY